MDYHILGKLKENKFVSQTSGGWKSSVRVLTLTRAFLLLHHMAERGRFKVCELARGAKAACLCQEPTPQ